eukprot:TRINITY_DN210_c0_g1_i2.p1 TRINITY_DN210_c0_g1~~TRINITY_DN210_c0_g1_i2.p1  ORF type:complete len:353 (-),score=93.73 TRINITY_DN210_c0_g1_i2:108-1166(-)
MTAPVVVLFERIMAVQQRWTEEGGDGDGDGDVHAPPQKRQRQACQQPHDAVTGDQKKKKTTLLRRDLEELGQLAREFAAACGGLDMMLATESVLSVVTGIATECLLQYHDTDAEIAQQALALLQFTAGAGDLTAAFTLALVFEAGFGTQKDPQKAGPLYQRAAYGAKTINLPPGCLILERLQQVLAKRQHVCQVNAMAALARCLLAGNGVAKDPAKAVALLERAAATGSVDAMVRLGWCFADHPDVPTDFARARALFQRAADKGDKEGQFGLACMLRRGRGGPRDRGLALSLFQLASDAGDCVAMLSVSKMLAKDKRDLVRATAWCRRAAAEGCEVIQENAKLVADKLGVSL